jgi:ATP adenylyltransferase
MKQIWAPWRLQYILGEKTKTCIFCHHPPSGQNKKSLLLHAGPSSLVMLNRYPYTSCHLLIAPRRHTSDIGALRADELLELYSTLRQSIELLKRSIKPAGFNVGMNLGRVAGAGITHHVHLHIVPRWQGDTNFMPIVAEAMVLPEHLDTTYKRLAPVFNKSFKPYPV